MITKQNLINLYDEIVLKKEVTEAYLIANEFTKKDITDLIREGILAKHNDVYIIQSVAQLLQKIINNTYTTKEKFELVNEQNNIKLLTNNELSEGMELIKNYENIDFQIYEANKIKYGVIQPKMTHLNKDEFKVIFNKAEQNYIDKEYLQSLKNYHKLACSNYNINAYGQIGVCYMRLEDYDKALEYLNIAKIMGQSKQKNVVIYNSLIKKLSKEISQNYIAKKVDLRIWHNLKKVEKILDNTDSIVLLKEKDLKDIAKIKENINYYPHLKLNVHYNSSRILAFYTKNIGKINTNLIIKYLEEAQKFYNEKNYEQALTYYKKILHGSDKMNDKIYLTMGICYRNLDNEMEYKKFKMIYRFFNENKYKKQSPTQEFLNIRKDSIIYSDNILNLIALINSGITFSDALKQINLSKEELQISKLLIAREYYSNGYISLGDKYLNQVKAIDSNYVRQIYDEINNNKRFFQNNPPKIRIHLKNR